MSWLVALWFVVTFWLGVLSQCRIVVRLVHWVGERMYS